MPLLHRQDGDATSQAQADAASQTQAVVEATLAAYRMALSFSINYIVVYLVQTFLVVFVLCVMARHTTPAIRRNPIFSILIICGVLSIAECAVNVSQLRDTLVIANTAVSRSRYTASIVFLFFIPWIADWTLIFRIAAFYPTQGRTKNRLKMLAAIAFPLLIKIPRIVFISLYTSFVWNATAGNPTMAEVVVAITDSQTSTVEWSLMLADQLYCTIFLVAQLWRLGWGWGETKRVSRSILESVKLVLISALASFFIPTCFLITLIVYQVNQLDQVTQGYIFVTCSHVVIIGCCFACLWPAIRASRERAASSRGMTGSSHEKTTSPHRSRGGQLPGSGSQMQSRGRNSLQLRRLDSLPQDLGYEDTGVPFQSYQKSGSLSGHHDIDDLSSKSKDGNTINEEGFGNEDCREEMNPFSQDEKKRLDSDYSLPGSPKNMNGNSGVRKRETRSNSNALSIEEECGRSRPILVEKKESEYFDSPSTLVGSPQSPSKFQSVKAGSDLENSPSLGRGGGFRNDGAVMVMTEGIDHPLHTQGRPFTPPNKNENCNDSNQGQVSPSAGDHPYSYSRTNSVSYKRDSRENDDSFVQPRNFQNVDLNDGSRSPPEKDSSGSRIASQRPNTSPSNQAQKINRRPVPQSVSNNNLRSDPQGQSSNVSGIRIISEVETSKAPPIEGKKLWNGRKAPQ